MAAKQKSKRVRQSAAAKPVKNAVRRCRIFEPFRTLGYVAGEVPHSIQMRGQDAFLTTSIGKSFHVYDIETLNLLFVGPHLYEDITSVISSGEHTYVAAGGKLVVCHRGKKITEIENTGRSPLRSLMIFGEHIVGYDDEGRISIWDSKTQDLFAQIALPKSDFHISCMLHPSTYLNKLLLGSISGRLEIWNIKTRKRIYEIKSFGSP
ncbi:rRNA-processing protein utp21, partial [Spiromyces aspiralis]